MRMRNIQMLAINGVTMKRILVIIHCLILCSCTSIPIGTMLKFSSFDESSFLKLDPNELKAKIHIDKPIGINISETTLSLTLITEKGKVIQSYPLKKYAVKTLPAESGWISSIAERTEYELVLTEEAIENFNIIQLKMRTEKPTGFKFGVDAILKDVPQEMRDVTLSIFVKLSDNSDYITLIDNASLEIERNG